MKRTLVVLIAAALAGCTEAPPADTHAADIKSLQDNEVQWNQDFQSKDVDKIAAHYTDDAVLMNSGMPASTGKDAIRKALKDMVADPAFALKFQATQVEVARSGDVGYTHGQYTMTITDPASKKVINDKGSYVTVYKKQADGSWKATEDAPISELPPPAPEPVKTAKKK